MNPADEKRKRREAATADKGVVGEGTTEESLSVEETNKLREQLGLRPLRQAEPEENAAAKKDDLRTQREEEKKERRAKELREQLAEHKEARRVQAELQQTQGIADQADAEEDTDVTAFIRKQREAEKRVKEEEKRKAEKTAQMLAERDQFDEEEAVSAHGQTAQGQQPHNVAAGIEVQHRSDEIAEGEEMELTLEDTRILNEKGELDEDGSTASLANTKLSEERRRARAKKAASNVHSDKRKDDPLAEPTSEHGILPQYDDVQTDFSRSQGRMRVDASGSLTQDAAGNDEQSAKHEDDELVKREVGKKLQERLKGMRHDDAAFSSGSLGHQKEYYTKEELAQFGGPGQKKQKKAKKPKKNLRKSKLTAEELEQIANEQQEADDSPADVRARDMQAQQARETSAKIEDERRRREAFERAKEREAENVRSKIGPAPSEALSHIPSTSNGETTATAPEEERDFDLGRALDRSKRTAEGTFPTGEQSSFPKRNASQHKHRYRRAADIAARIAEQGNKHGDANDDNHDEGDGNKVVLSDTAEFVRGITTEIGSELPTFHAAEEDSEQEKQPHIKTDPEENPNVKEEDEKPDVFKTDVHVEPDEHLKALKPEVDTTRGVAGALQIMQHTNTPQTMESYQLAGRPSEKKGESLRVMREAAEIDPGGFNGRKFNFSLNQYDEFGRLMTPKEAFRQMCWRFHGMPPGKARKEKRLREVKEEKDLKGMAQGDTPTGSMNRVFEVQRQQASPYVVLSGKVNPGQASDAATGYSYAEKEENTALHNTGSIASALMSESQWSSEPQATQDAANAFNQSAGQNRKVEFNLGSKRKASAAASGHGSKRARTKAVEPHYDDNDNDE